MPGHHAPPRRLSSAGSLLQTKCSQLLSNIDDLEDPADIEDAVMDFVPKDEPFRSEAIDTLGKVRTALRARENIFRSH